MQKAEVRYNMSSEDEFDGNGEVTERCLHRNAENLQKPVIDRAEA